MLNDVKAILQMHYDDDDISVMRVRMLTTSSTWNATNQWSTLGWC